MRAHAQDLRAEVPESFGLDGEPADAFVGRVSTGWRKAPLSEADRALCAYAEKLTLAPREVIEADVAALRRAGWGDDVIHDAAQVVAYFNYINRIANGLGVALESHVPAWERWSEQGGAPPPPAPDGGDGDRG